MSRRSRCRVGVGTPRQGFADEQKKAIGLRREARRLHFELGYSKTQIAQVLNVSKGFVVNWTQSSRREPARDGRGWRRGRARKWGAATRRRVRQVHSELERSPREFYSGASAIAQRFRQRYPNSPVPPLRTIGRILAEEGLTRTPKQRVKGASRYLCYPEHTVYETLGRRVLEADFIGHKYLTGSSAPLHFMGFSFKKAPKLRYFQRVEAQTTTAVLDACTRFFKAFEYPDVMKVDNDPATIGTGSGRRCLSQFMVFLLNRRIVPVFAVPRKPFSQASIEGNNSVFSRKFWNTHTFRSLSGVDKRLAWFNDSSQAYTGYQAPKRRARPSRKAFVPRVYFLRQVQEDADTGRGLIDVANEPLSLPQRYINYFVLAEWNLADQQLHVWFEREQTAKAIKSMNFEINSNSKYRLS